MSPTITVEPASDAPVITLDANRQRMRDELGMGPTDIEARSTLARMSSGR